MQQSSEDSPFMSRTFWQISLSLKLHITVGLFSCNAFIYIILTSQHVYSFSIFLATYSIAFVLLKLHHHFVSVGIPAIDFQIVSVLVSLIVFRLFTKQHCWKTHWNINLQYYSSLNGLQLHNIIFYCSNIFFSCMINILNWLYTHIHKKTRNMAHIIDMFHKKN